MPAQQNDASSSTVLFPRGWTKSVNSAVLQVISLAQFSLTVARGQTIGKQGGRNVVVDRLRQELALLEEEHRLLRDRFGRLAPHKRPHYTPVERLAILELRAARGWSVVQTAKRFLVSPETIASWCRCLDDEDALVQRAEPVNRFPAFVRYSVRRLKVLCPTLGSQKIAQMLCRAGLHLAATTVKRILKEPTQPPEVSEERDSAPVVARKPNEVWHVDLTTVPIGGGFWTMWFPFALPPRWPICWWIAVVVDQFSRRAMGFAVFTKQPTAVEVRRFLGRPVREAQVSPTVLITDRGRQFIAKRLRKWCGQRSIELRHGAVGKRGSIAIVERFVRTLKDEGTRRGMVSINQHEFRLQLCAFVDWYNEYRPHSSLGGRTPHEVYHGLRPANRRPRLEPRERWPRGSPCARPQTLVAGQPGDGFRLVVQFHQGQRHLPIVSLQRVA